MKFRELAPEDVEGFILRGYAQLIPGNWDAAIKDFKAAIKKAGGIQPEAESAIACALINRWLAENAVTQIPWKTRMPAPLLAEAKGYAESSFDTWPAGNWPATFALALRGIRGRPRIGRAARRPVSQILLMTIPTRKSRRRSSIFFWEITRAPGRNCRMRSRYALPRGLISSRAGPCCRKPRRSIRTGIAKVPPTPQGRRSSITASPWSSRPKPTGLFLPGRSSGRSNGSSAAGDDIFSLARLARFLFARKSQSALPWYTEPALECERVGNAIELRGS